ncbi:ATG8-interacting protein 1 [Phalaenopsis equestris]|uniref:ATG8-interacting protein 1 n=1 Tax=Phalaenopsis equestris TaxID=78828 RepID=UPI0009E5D42A|nr:ATG8-interacting protein 1 [Phalaenopsis equestris]
MADEEQKDGTSSRGADWEVVALTASTYAAAPGADADPADDSRDKEFQQERESSNTMFMSQHFIFPPHEHENLPIEAEYGEIFDQTARYVILPAAVENNYPVKFNEDFSEAELSVNSMESQEGQPHNCFNAETDSRQRISTDDVYDISDIFDSSNKNHGMPPDFAKLGKTIHGSGGSCLPIESWWKRNAMSLYKKAKETNPFWSIFIAAAFMGVAILGQQWQREKLQLQQLKWQFSITNERMSRLLGSVSRFKYVFVGGHRHSSLIHGSAAVNI